MTSLHLTKVLFVLMDGRDSSALGGPSLGLERHATPPLLPASRIERTKLERAVGHRQLQLGRW